MLLPSPQRWITLLCGAALSSPAILAQNDPTITEAPVRGYVCIEPFEIRQEFIVELGALGHRIQPTPTGDLAPSRQRAVLDQLRGQLAAASMIRADGDAVTFALDQIQFVVMDPDLGPVLDERAAIPSSEAIVAASFAAERPDFPGVLEITWELLPDPDTGVSEVPVEIEVTTHTSIHTEALTFSREDAIQTWALPAVGAPPGLLAVVEVQRDDRAAPTIVASLFIAFGIVLVALAIRKRPADRPSLLLAGALALIFGGGALFTVARESAQGQVEEVEARSIVDALLNNVYHAFAYREESKVFDTLASSVDGPLLEKLYLDIRRGFELEELGGPRVKVLRVSVVKCDLQRVTDGGLKARVVWVSSGNVSHWGHSHRRRNQYRADLLIRAVDGRWKVTGVDIIDEQRT